MSNYNERLDEILNSLANKVEWCVRPELLSQATVDRTREYEAINEAKQAFLSDLLEIIEENCIYEGSLEIRYELLIAVKEYCK